MIQQLDLHHQDNDDVTLTEMAFRKSQIPNKLVVVEDGREALDFVFYKGKYTNRTPVENPALILLDLKLPLVSGLDVLKELKANSNTC